MTCGRSVFFFKSDTLVSSTNKTTHDDIIEILLKVTLNTHNCNSISMKIEEPSQTYIILFPFNGHEPIITCRYIKEP